MIRRHVVVTGQVQGVFFRASLEQEARAAGVAGWVRNRPDGSVEAALEGGPSAVERVLAWCHQGPPRARVDDVVVTAQQPEGSGGFAVLG